VDDLFIAVAAGVAELLVALGSRSGFSSRRRIARRVRSHWAQQARWVVVMQIVFGVVMWIVYAGAVFVGGVVLLVFWLSQ